MLYQKYSVSTKGSGHHLCGNLIKLYFTQQFRDWHIHINLNTNIKDNQNISRWRHQMETFSALLDICVANSPVSGDLPAQRPVTRSFDFSLICAWMNGWVNTGEAGDQRRYRAHYDVTIMYNQPEMHIFLHTIHWTWISPVSSKIYQG